MRILKTLPGDHIRDCCQKALALAVENNETVQFAFNDKIIIARPDSTLDELHVQWGHPILSADEERANATADLEKMKREQAEAIAKAGAATEAELRDMPEPWPKSMDELTSYIKALTDRPHDYGTCCYAMSLAAVAAFNFVASKLGTTGFQAGCAQMDFIRRERNLKHGFQLVDYERLLYPQYIDELTITPAILLSKPDIRKSIAEAAKQKLAESGSNCHPEVRAHWERLAAMEAGSSVLTAGPQAV